MAHFAEIDSNNIVKRVTVVSNNDCLDDDGNESEIVGASFCESLLGGRWKQTSYNHNFRKQFAGSGMIYSEELDMFVLPRPKEWFTLNADGEWVVPLGINTETGATLTPEEWEWLDLCFAINVTFGGNIG